MSQVTVRVPGTTANCGPGFDAVGIACSIYNEIKLHHFCQAEAIRLKLSAKEKDKSRVMTATVSAVKRVFEQLGQPAVSLTLDQQHSLGSRFRQQRRRDCWRLSCCKRGDWLDIEHSRAARPGEKWKVILIMSRRR